MSMKTGETGWSADNVTGALDLYYNASLVFGS